jgi:hypothetical protein
MNKLTGIHRQVIFFLLFILGKIYICIHVFICMYSRFGKHDYMAYVPVQLLGARILIRIALAVPFLPLTSQFSFIEYSQYTNSQGYSPSVIIIAGIM